MLSVCARTCVRGCMRVCARVQVRMCGDLAGTSSSKGVHPPHRSSAPHLVEEQQVQMPAPVRGRVERVVLGLRVHPLLTLQLSIRDSLV